MKNQSFLAHALQLGAVLFVLLVVVCPIPSKGQAMPNPVNPKRTTATPDAESRAEQEADRLVSLSAEKIITLLDQEPGLLLQVKKMLVRKAYEQGRLLDPEDLTDDALFKLIGRDENIRVLVTREIEDREYVRAKPTRGELERERQRMGPQTLAVNAAQEKPAEGKNQEEKYWSQHAHDFDNNLQNPPYSEPPQSTPAPAPQPQILAPNDPRAVERTQLQYPQAQYPMEDSGGFGDFSGGMPLSAAGMQGISPDQLSGLMAARMASSSGGSQGGEMGDDGSSRMALGMSSMGGMSGGMSASDLTNPLLSPSLSGSAPDLTQLGGQQFPQQANLRMPRRPKTPSASDLGLDRPVLTRRPNPYADVPSLYDLYSQYSRRISSAREIRQRSLPGRHRHF